MKRTFVLIILSLFLPVSVYAQVDEKTFLSEAMTWVDTNLQCEQYFEKYPGTVIDKITRYKTPTVKSTPVVPPLGKCQIAQKLFCHLKSEDKEELILRVSGSGTGGMELNWQDNKFIFFSLSNTVLIGSVFYEMSDPHLEAATASVIKFEKGPDLIRIDDGGEYCGESESHLFELIDGKMKKQLDFKYVGSCHQSCEGLESILIPLKNRSLRLLKLKRTVNPREGSMGDCDVSYSEIIYEYDPSSAIYVTKEEKELSLGNGILDWRENHPGSTHYRYSKINHKMYVPEYRQIENDKQSLEDLIVNLKNENQSRKNLAYTLLVEIAGKDFGENYLSWEKWKNELKVETKQDDLDQN